MRYLVKAKLKSAKERALIRAIDAGTLGRGSIAGDEYLHNMEQARVDNLGSRNLGGDLLLRSPARGGTTVLGRVFRIAQCEGCALAAQLRAREWNRTVGLLRL